MANVNILVGTVTGKALKAANAIAETLNGNGHLAHVYEKPTLEALTDQSAPNIIFVVSSTGQGDLPQSIVPLYAEIQDKFSLLNQKRFAVIGLGDSSYSTFCQAAATMEELMFELQAQPLCERFNIDATEHYDPVDVATGWAVNCAEIL